MKMSFLRPATIAAALLLAAVFVGCKPKNNYNIYVIKRNNEYAVYDSNSCMKTFVYRTLCDTPLLDKDSIVIGFNTDSTHYCWWEPRTFKGYSTKDSAEFVADKWREYGYDPKSNSR